MQELEFGRYLRQSTYSALLLFGATSVASGAGFFLPNQSTEATARGNAWVATANSAAAVHYNPAGLVQMQTRSVEAGVYTIHLGNKVDIGGTTYEADGKWQPVPHIYYAQPINDDLTFGFGLNSPFGLGTEWGHNTPFRHVTTNAELMYIRASAVVGYRVNDCFSVGGGVSINYAEAILEQGLTGFDPMVPATNRVRFKGDDLAPSWIVGFLWQPYEKHSFGAVYRSMADFDLDGTLSGSGGVGLPLGSADLGIITPASAAIGYAYKPTEKLTIEVNVEWIDWDNLNSITISTPLGDLPTQRFDWESSFVYEVGFTYEINDRYEVSMGYDYNEGASPDAYYNPAVADADRHWLNAGVTCKGDGFTWQAAYQYGFSDNNVTGSLIGTNGNYDAEHHAIMLSGRFDF